jgi:hypothetical protein
MLRQFFFDAGNQVFPLLVRLVLRVEKRTVLVIALRLERLDLLLPRQFFLQRQTGSRENVYEGPCARTDNRRALRRRLRRSWNSSQRSLLPEFPEPEVLSEGLDFRNL